MTDTQTGNERERVVFELIATDRIYIPVNSMVKKLEQARKKLATETAEVLGDEDYQGERFYARIETEDREKARGMREGIDAFKKAHPEYGRILEGMITEKRISKERHLEFGMQPDKRLTADDYMAVMKSLGLSETTARSMYPDLMKLSHTLQRKRDYAQRSIIVG